MRYANNMWNMTTECIRKAAIEVPGISRGIFGGRKEDWWWNGEVQDKVKLKKVAYMKWLECVDEDEKRRLKNIYETAKIEAKSTIRSAKTVTFEERDKILIDLRKRRREKLAIWIKRSVSRMGEMRCWQMRPPLSRGGKLTSTSS